MLRKLSIMALALLVSGLASGCDWGAGRNGDGEATPGASDSGTPTPPAPPVTPTEPAADARRNGARSVAEETDDFLFEYSYPSAAGNIDMLGDLLDTRLDRVRGELASTSADARREAREDGFPYNKHSYQGTWEVVADMPAWLSLSHEFSTYSGGAHGMYGLQALVWDKTAQRAFEPVDLFTSPAALEQALGDRYCDALNAERREKDVEPPQDDSVFPRCPGIEELTVLVGSSDRRHFNRLTLYAGPYVAGSYAEGAYEVNVNVDKAVIAAVKPEYRASFRAR